MKNRINIDTIRKIFVTIMVSALASAAFTPAYGLFPDSYASQPAGAHAVAAQDATTPAAAKQADTATTQPAAKQPAAAAKDTTGAATAPPASTGAATAPPAATGAAVAAPSVITWDPNGGTTPIASSAGTVGSPVGTRPVPTRTGYAFKGWYTQKTGGIRVTEHTLVTDTAVTYYATWKANSYKVALNANGGKIGSYLVRHRTFTYGSASPALPVPTLNRSKFKGWYTAVSGGKKIGASTIYRTPSAITLYARWQAATKVKYVFVTYGGKVSVPSKSYAYDKKIKSMPAPSRNRYDFRGWYTKPVGGTWVGAGTMVTTQSVQQSLYARWAPHQYFQYDLRWAFKKYMPTIASSGCCVSAISIVVYTLAGKGVTPAVAAKYSMSKGYNTSAPGKTKLPFLVNFTKKYGVKATKVYSGDLRNLSAKAKKQYNDRATQAVKNGNWVVCFMAPGNWTHHGHFIVWYDIEGNKALVRDPNATKPAKTRNTIKLLESQAINYWIITVPDGKKIRPPQ